MGNKVTNLISHSFSEEIFPRSRFWMVQPWIEQQKKKLCRNSSIKLKPFSGTSPPHPTSGVEVKENSGGKFDQWTSFSRRASFPPGFWEEEGEKKLQSMGWTSVRWLRLKLQEQKGNFSLSGTERGKKEKKEKVTPRWKQLNDCVARSEWTNLKNELLPPPPW